MGDTGPTFKVLDTHRNHNIYLGRQPLFPLELILCILQHLEGEYATLLHLSSTCKLLHTEARPLLYRSLGRNGGPPPKCFIKNPSLAKFMREITYVQHINVKPSQTMEQILSGSFAHRLPNLKLLTVTFERRLPKNFLSKGGFRLEELSLYGDLFPSDLETSLRHQNNLKKLRTMDWNRGSRPIPLSICPDLHTLEGDISVIEVFLPLHNIRTLIWELWYYDSNQDQLVNGLDHLARGLRGLKKLYYPLAANLPTLNSLTKHLTNLQYLAIEHSTMMGKDSIREYSILTDLSQDISAILHLRGLVLSSSHSYTPSDITNDFMESLFQACPRLEFIDVEMHGLYYPRQFTRWIRGSSGELCTKRDVSLVYRNLADGFY
ncbi:hypothetical protein CPB83DRAFT_857516 [Crepidotus variabilis]|uniref:F-box domain-containing protein n=1 Tax=Crepidotus variabilis TaxID=179855 RepID=A0A9P6JMS3_9AGAR|nr:hypothetical protein CPB83DRAFT_857516 [Crepidotus variabilis]